MIAAIKELVDKKGALIGKSDLITAEYLEACHLIFEKGILSHEMISSSDSQCLTNISEGMNWFFRWKGELQEKPGNNGTCI